MFKERLVKDILTKEKNYGTLIDKSRQSREVEISRNVRLSQTLNNGHMLFEFPSSPPSRSCLLY